ncbi:MULTISPECIES: protein kinase [unclassified Mycolicibacterium]|uniref:protein kinase domain-containing protein n=1 Tax=unclassified Mycolicibacterium TaxID=2636767 RepID=UPI001EE4214F|nr:MULTISPECIES: protein kinase [unclassified Mycolicibacterium]MUM08097.1 serine/threonine protein kinase [Mycolicibacterium sp. CBMA 213]
MLLTQEILEPYHCQVQPSQQPDPLIGAELDGRYRVDAPIASGGMSTVYRGLDTRLDRLVALKVMDSRYSGDQQFLTRFQREARAAAGLKSPGLVAVYDQGFDGRHPFLVMELVEGGTLRELLRERGPMPPHAVAAVLAPMLDGLAVAHAAGLVHRDIKPENVLISDTGEVKIADFGLVRAVAEAKITSTSVILGTAAYLSPEQVSTGDADPRSDVYSVGILAYELLTGVTPFTGDNPLTVAYQRLDHDVPPPSAAIAGVPKQFDDFVACATARDVDDRYHDAGDMAAELAAIVADLGLPEFQVPAPQHSAQHTAAAVQRGRADRTTVATGRAAAGAKPKPPPQHTLQFTMDPAIDPGAPESPVPARQFAGVDLDDFAWARHRSRRAAVFWVLAILTLTTLVATGAWTVGSNIGGLF